MLRSRFLWKLFAGSAALVLLVLAGVGKAFHARHAEAALGAAEEQLALIALTIAADFDARLATASDHVDWELSPPILERAAALELRVLVVDPRGNVVARFPANAAAFGGRSVFAPGSPLERAAVQDGGPKTSTQCS